MTWYNSLNKDIDDDVIIPLLLNYPVNNNNDEYYTDVNISIENPWYLLKALIKKFKPDILPLRFPLPCHIFYNTKGEISVMKNVYNQGGVISPDIVN